MHNQISHRARRGWVGRRNGFAIDRARLRRRPSRRYLLERLEPRQLLASDLVITEFQASNQSTLLDADGDSSDWIEIYNFGDQAADLSGWHLTDDPDDLDKWEFPAFTLEPFASLVVFASGKDRTDPAGQLHSNFNLDTSGGFLALVQPDGTTIADQYQPSYPPQFSDISYGVGTSVAVTTLLPEGSSTSVLIPHDGALGTEWTTPEFTPDASWITESSPGVPAITPVGFDNETSIPNLVAHWPLNEAAGTAGSGSVEDATGGGHDGTPTGSLVFGSAGASQYTDLSMSISNGSVDVPHDPLLNPASFTFAAWVYPRSTAGFQSVVTSRLDTFPNLYGYVLYNDNAGQWSFWTGSGANAGGWSTLAGPAVVTNAWSHMAISFNAASNTKTMWINGTPVASSTTQGYSPNTLRDLHIGGGGDFGTQYPFDGLIDDAALFNTALDQAAIQELLNFGVPDSSATNYSQIVQTNLTSAMQDVNASAYVRSEFEVEDLASFQQLHLNIRYDDGFVAYLNGTQVAARNAPATLAWDSAATAERADSLGAELEAIDITNSIPLLQAGTNLLAIHGLNASASDADFLLSPELVAVSAADVREAVGYFVEPTPGRLNGTPILIGPQITDVAHSPEIPDQRESVTVTATVTPRLAAVANVSLVYRLMYGPESTVTMVDDGTDADQVAGDHTYTAVISRPPAVAGQMLRYYVTAQDDLSNNSREPANLDREGTKQSPVYFGTIIRNSSVSTTLPEFQWFTENVAAAHSRVGTRASVYYAGRFYDNVFARQRGGFTNAAVSQKFVFNRGHELWLNDTVGEVQEININGPGSDASYLRQAQAYTSHQVTGAASSESFLAHLSVNGSFDRIGIMIEQVDEDFLDRFGYDPDGDLYKFVQRSNLNPVFFDTSTGIEKKTGDLSDFSSIIALVQGLNNGSSTIKQAYVRDFVDIPQFINYLAMRSVQQQADDVRKNFYMYYDTHGDQLWRIFPWDLDWTFEIVGGHGQERTEHPYFGVQAFPTDDGNNQWNVLYNVLLSSGPTQQMLLRRIRTLMDQFYGGPPGTPGTTWFADQTNAGFVQIDPFLGTGVTSAKDSLLASIENRRRDLYVDFTASIPGTVFVIPEAQVGNPNIEFGVIDFNPISGNQDEEYIQLNNPNTFAVDLSGWRLEGGVQYTFPPGSVISASGALYLSPNAVAFKARTAAPTGRRGLFVQGDYQGHLSSFGETLTLIGADGGIVSSITYEGDPSDAQQFLRITELNYNPPPPTEAELAVDPDLDNDDFEFIELVNTATVPLDLAGVHFSQGVQFGFSDGVLEAGQRALIVRDRDAFQLRYGTDHDIAGVYLSGSLDNAGESVKLEDSLNGTIHEFAYDDQGDWPEEADGRGASLQVVDTEGDYSLASNWRSSVEYLGSPAAPGLPPTIDVVINEVLSHTDPPQLDAIELFNSGTIAVDISGWYLSDTSDNYRKYQMPAGTVLAPQQYLVFDESDFNASMGSDPNDFALNSAHGDDVWLMASDGTGAITRFVNHAGFGAQANGESWGRWPNVTSALYPMSAVSLGAANLGPRVGPIVISELMYHPPNPDGPGGVDADDLEYVEISNPTTVPVDLTGWRIDGGIDFDFPAGTQLESGQSLVVLRFNPLLASNTQRLADFRQHYSLSDDVVLVGGYAGKLGNEGDIVQLLRPDEPPAEEPEFIPRLLEDEVRYDDVAPWPVESDGTGQSLTRVGQQLWGNDAASWIAVVPTPGQVVEATLQASSWQINTGLVDPPPPSGAAPTSWALQRSQLQQITLTFNRPIQATAADVVLTNLGVNAPMDDDAVIALSASHVTVSGSQLVINMPAEMVSDGVYELRILSSVTDLLGAALDGDSDGVAGGEYVVRGNMDNRLFQLGGDWNGDGAVSIFDFPTLAYWFGRSVPDAPRYVDLNGDDSVTIFDFPRFAASFSNQVVFPPGLAADAVSVAALMDRSDRQTMDRAPRERSSVEHPLDAVEQIAPVRANRDVVRDRLAPDQGAADADHQPAASTLEHVLDEIAGDVLQAWTR